MKIIQRRARNLRLEKVRYQPRLHSLHFARSDCFFHPVQLAVAGSENNARDRMTMHGLDQVRNRLLFDVNPGDNLHEQLLLRRESLLQDRNILR